MFLCGLSLLARRFTQEIPPMTLTGWGLTLGGALLLAADAMSRSIGSGSALPVGAITSLLGAPFFLTLIFGKKEGGVC